MNINKENIDDLNAVVSVQITEEDYSAKVNEVLADYRKKANIHGFRPGKAPVGLVNKMYGKAVLLDEVNKILSENLTKYLFEGDFKVLGEPLPSDKSPKIDWETQKEFNFSFDIGLAPTVELNLSKRDKVKWYDIEVDETIINDQVENYTKRFGGFEPTDVAEEEDMIKGDLTELNEDGTKKEGGFVAIDALVSLNTIENEEAKKQFLGLKIGDEITVDMNQTFPNEAEKAGLLKLKKEELEGLSNKFQYTIGEVTRFQSVAVNQELFDKVYGEGTVKDEAEFKEKIKTELKGHLDRESNYKFTIDAKEKLVKKTNLDLPEAFLKRWMLATSEDEKLTPEGLDKDFPAFADDLKWQLVKDFIVTGNELTVVQDEISAEAVNVARAQFQQYGIHDAPEEQLKQFSQSILTNKEEERKIKDRILEDKVISFVREAIKLDEQKVSLDEFKALFE